MQAVLQEYLEENIAQYLSRMFRITKGIIPDEENKTTRLHVCSFHFLKLNKDFINKKYDRKNNRSKLHICLRSLGRLICCINLEQALAICRHMTVAITGRYVTTLVDESIKYLQDPVNKFKVLEQLEVKPAECTTELDESESTTGEQLESKSPWKDFWDDELHHYDEEKFNENEDNNHLAESKYFVYEYFHEFKRHLQFLPIWSRVCELGNLNEKTPMTNAHA